MSRESLIANLTQEFPNRQDLGRVSVEPLLTGFHVIGYCHLTGSVPVLAEVRNGVAIIRELPRYAPRSLRRWHRAVVYALEQRELTQVFYASSNQYQSLLDYSFQMRVKP